MSPNLTLYDKCYVCSFFGRGPWSLAFTGLLKFKSSWLSLASSL